MNFLHPLCGIFNFHSLFDIYFNMLVSNFNLMTCTTTAITVTPILKVDFSFFKVVIPGACLWQTCAVRTE